MEVTSAGEEWESPPTITSIRLRHRQCRPPNCLSTCPADQFEPGELRGGCNTTAILQNDGHSYVARLVGLQGLEGNGSLTIDFYQNGTNIPNTPVAYCDDADCTNKCTSDDECTKSGKSQCCLKRTAACPNGKKICAQCNEDSDCGGGKFCC